MRLDEARVAIAGLNVPAGAADGCAYASAGSLPKGVSIMIENGVLARVDIDSGSAVKTAAGAGIGDTEDALRTLYGSRLTSAPAKYSGGHDLSVAPKSPADTLHRIIFETEGGKVVRYRAGQLPQVLYVERCG
jgi:hypothetical protein